MSEKIIKKICKEVGISIEQKVVTNNLVELIYKVIDDFDSYSKKFTDMILEIHNEVDAFRSGYIVNHLEYDTKSKEAIPIPDCLVDFLKETKEKNIEFWRSEN